MRRVTRRRFLGGSAVGIAATSLCAQDWFRFEVDKSSRLHEWVTVKYEARSVESFVAYPPSPKAPAMVVIHDVVAMAPWVELVADRLAEAGYLAIAPDMLSGRSPEEREPLKSEKGLVGPARRLPPAQVAADLNALVDYALKLPACNGKVGVVGFSWGGDQAFRLAATRRDLAAAFVFYGVSPEPEAIPNIQAPVYGFYGGTDTRVNTTIPATQQQMKAAGKFYEPVIYEGAAHGFMQAGARPDAAQADRKACDAAWIKLRALRDKLGR